MTQITKTNNGWKATERDPVDGEVIGIRLIYRGPTLDPTGVRVSTASAAQDFPYDHNRSSTENAADCLDNWLKFRRDLKEWYPQRDRCATAEERGKLPTLTMPGTDE